MGATLCNTATLYSILKPNMSYLMNEYFIHEMQLRHQLVKEAFNNGNFLSNIRIGFANQPCTIRSWLRLNNISQIHSPHNNQTKSVQTKYCMLRICGTITLQVSHCKRTSIKYELVRLTIGARGMNANYTECRQSGKRGCLLLHQARNSLICWQT